MASVESDGRSLKETVNKAITDFQKHHPEMGVALVYSEDKGLNIDIKPKAPIGYSVKAGNTVPLAARAKPADGGK